MWYPELKLNQDNRITFVLVDGNYTEVPGLGNTFSLFVSKNGGPYLPSAAAKAEIFHGWYTAILPAAECDTIGPVSVYITGAGIITQNLEYVVQQRNAGCLSFTYTAINSVTLAPIPDADVWFATDVAGTQVVWFGSSDAFGIAKDIEGHIPCLDAGTYYVFKHKPGFIDDDNPDIEIVS